MAWASLGLGFPWIPRRRRGIAISGRVGILGQAFVALVMIVGLSACCSDCRRYPIRYSEPEDDTVTPDDGPPLVVDDLEVSAINEDTSTLAGGLNTQPTPPPGASNATKGSSSSAATAGGAGPGGGSSGAGDAAGLGVPEVGVPEAGGGGGGGGSAGGGGGGGLVADGTQAAATQATGGAFDNSMDEAAYAGGGGKGGKEGGGNPLSGLFGAGGKDGGAGGGDSALDFAGQGAELDSMVGEDPDDYFSRTNPNANLFVIVHQRYEKKHAGWVLTDTRGALSEGADLLQKAKAGAAPPVKP